MNNKKSEYSIIAGQFATAKAKQKENTDASQLKGSGPPQPSLDEQNRRAEIQFKSLHLLMVTFFLWILYARFLFVTHMNLANWLVKTSSHHWHILLY